MIGSVMISLLKLLQSRGVEPHQSDDCESEHDVDEIEH
jgi:hypothetical protein